MMKNGLIILTLCTLLLACSQPDTHDSLGRPITFNHYRGQWLIINYWAPWCKPCLTELPDLNQLYLQNTHRIMVLGISFDKLTKQAINAFRLKLAIRFPMLPHLPSQQFGINEIKYLPMTLLITPQGKLYKTLYGPQKPDTLLREIKQAVQANPSLAHTTTSPKGNNR